MSSSVGDSVLDFDLNFLHSTTNNTVDNATARRKAIYMVKKKTIATDTLIRAFYAKKDALDQAEKEILATKEECKQICIEYKKAQDACGQYEKELQLTRNTVNMIENKHVNLENQVAASNSLIHQLQTLLQDKDTLIDALKIENKLNNHNVKDSDKKTLLALQKENETLKKLLSSTKELNIGKTKTRSHRKLKLKKSDKNDCQNKIVSLFGEEESNEEYASDEISLSPFSEDYVDEAESSKIKLHNTKRKELNTTEQVRSSINSAECNDQGSIDTGRGSSRAFSGSDKCFQSPDYFNDDNPLCYDPTLNKIKIKFIDSATSPIHDTVRVHVSTSPIVFDEILINNSSCKDISVITDNHPMIDRALSPIVLENTADYNGTSVRNCDTSSVVDLNPNGRNAVETGSNDNENIEGDKKRKVEECLELNNSVNICHESNDCEIEMIFSTMRLHNKLITPIPVTPAKPIFESRVNAHPTVSKKQEHLVENDCQLEISTKQEMNQLRALVSDVMKRLSNIEKKFNDSHAINTDGPYDIIYKDKSTFMSNKNGSIDIFDKHRPNIVPHTIQSTEMPNKDRSFAVNTGKEHIEMLDNDGPMEMTHNNSSNEMLANNIPIKLTHTNGSTHTLSNDGFIAADCDIEMLDNIERIEVPHNIGTTAVPHSDGSIEMRNNEGSISVISGIKTVDNVDLIEVPDIIGQRAVSHTNGFIETFNNNPIAVNSGNTPVTMLNNDGPIEMPNHDEPIAVNSDNEPNEMLCNGGPSEVPRDDVSIIVPQTIGYMEMLNSDESIAVNSENEPNEILDNGGYSEVARYDVSIIEPHTKGLIASLHNAESVAVNSDNEPNEMLDNNGPTEEPNDNVSIIVPHTNKPIETLYSAESIAANSDNKPNEMVDNDGPTEVPHNNVSIIVPHANRSIEMLNNDESIAVNSDNDTNVIVGNGSSDVPHNNTPTEMRFTCESTAVTYNNRPMLMAETNKGIKMLNNYGHFAMEINKSSMIPHNYDCTIVGKNIGLIKPLSDNESIVADKDSKYIAKPNSNGIMSVNRSYEFIETHSGNGSLAMDKCVGSTVISNTNRPKRSDKLDEAMQKSHNKIVVNNEIGSTDDKTENFVMKHCNLSTIPITVCHTNDQTCNTKIRRSKSKRKSSLSCVVEEVTNNTHEQEVSTNVMRKLEENPTKLPLLQSEDITPKVPDSDNVLSGISSKNVRNSDTPALYKDCQSPCKIDEGKSVKTRKLTKLGKFKQKLLPKYKIKREYLPLKKSAKSTEIKNPNKKINITEADSSATLNNKDAYEKAVKVISELKRKNNNEDTDNKFVQSSTKSDKKMHVGDVEQIEEKNLKESDWLFSKSSTPIQSPSVNTRSRSRFIAQSPVNNSLNQISPMNSPSKITDVIERYIVNKHLTKSPELKRQRKRVCEETPTEIPCKRLLRWSTSDNCSEKEPKVVLHRFEDPFSLDSKIVLDIKSNMLLTVHHSPKGNKSPIKRNLDIKDDLEINKKISKVQVPGIGSPNYTDNPRDSILCQMIQRYGVRAVKSSSKKVSDSVANSIAKKIEEGISRIIGLPTQETKDAMNKFVAEILNWDIKDFLTGLMKYLKDPVRRNELFAKDVAPSAPGLTKAEQILLYVVSELKTRLRSVDIVDNILNCMEYTLFALNRTPPFEVIESMAHFYAVICRYFKMKTRLRLFILDAMYCIQYKAVPLIRQCIEVWMHILPLAHMTSAKTPLVTCLVYLLHFYKCEDKLNRVQDMRNILQRKYFYTITEWNETKILELFRNSIKSLRGLPTEVKMLRIALIILAKRHGPRWCQNNIVRNILKPMIEMKNVSVQVKAFCLSMLGPLLKPYPADMKVHCEIVMNQLIEMFQKNQSPRIAEAIVASLIYLNKHNQFRVIQTLVLWRPKEVSTELEVILKDFVKSKPLKLWKSTLSRTVQ